jgi:hypothetical protein
MMGKKLRNLALLGGLGAAAYMMGSKKGESKTESKEDRERDARERFVSRSLEKQLNLKKTESVMLVKKPFLAMLNLEKLTIRKKLTLNPLLLLKLKLVL